MSALNTGGKIAQMVFLLILILALIFGGLVWLDFLGLIDFKSQLSPLTTRIGISRESTEDRPFSPVLLDDERLAKERQAIAIGQRELSQLLTDLEMREAQLTQKESELAEREKSVEEKQNSLNAAISQYDNRVANLEQSARYLMGMPPEDAVAIMAQYEIKDLVDLLRTSERLSREDGETSLVAYWLSIMPDRNRAADIQRLLVIKPGLILSD